MKNYPHSNRKVDERGDLKTEADRSIARKFGEEFFDGSRVQGYGGFNYAPHFWEKVVPDFQMHWGLKAGDCVLDIGCAKGFMLYDMMRLIPGLTVRGLDISEYAIANAIEAVKPFCQVGTALALPFPDKSIDVTISIAAIHNLDRGDCIKALKEIERVSRKGSFVTVSSYRDSEEEKRQYAWNLTAKTILSVNEWKELFEESGYTGDYYWFIA
ncbi:class I SAM-dependent methyltransferase [Kiloniella laminariae]|uniref:class I SAM-dependent methyltransferase n=1 Tax=Kiloniella laminariae TaxID=454162 RepID=UPI0003782159|nr:class I SAM-dependent methyltransferase [Kiloniella laminariae]